MIMEDGVVYENLTESLAAVFRGSVTPYTGTIVLSTACIVIVLCHITIMLSTKKFRQNYQIAIALSFTYIFTLSSFTLEASTRIKFYLDSVEIMAVPVVSSRDCIKTWILFQAFGDISAPLLEFLMAMERFLAVFSPMFYRRVLADHKATFFWISFAMIFALVSVFVPTGISFFVPQANVKYDCGRKAALGYEFGLCDYAFCMTVHTVAFALNLFTFIKARGIRQSSANYKKLKVYTCISGLSTALIAFPNACSFYSAFVALPPQVFMKYTNQMSCANCVLMIIIYFIMNPDYRKRCLAGITCGHVDVLPSFMVPAVTSTIDAKQIVSTVGKSTMLVTLSPNANDK